MPEAEDAINAVAVTLLGCLSFPACAEGPAVAVSGAEEQEIKAVLAGHSFRQSIRRLPTVTGGAGQ